MSEVMKKKRVAWNKGLTKDDPRVKRNIESRNKTMIERYGSLSYNNSEKREQTCMERYGVSNAFQTQDYNERCTKSKQTCLEKYGVEHVMQVEEFKDKNKQSLREHYGVSSVSQLPGIGDKISKSRSSESAIKKAESTCIKRYGVPYIKQLPEFREKAYNTMLERYGVRHYTNKEKEYATKLNNGTLYQRISNLEEEYKQKLIEQYGEDDVVHQYRSEEYPFNCDFYIKSKDLYIEYNGFFTHGGHPYDENNPEDIQLADKLRNSDNEFDKNFLYTWTDLDVRKRNTAKINNLNYMAVYPNFKGEDIVYSHMKV